MDRQQQFLFVVQSAMTANAVRNNVKGNITEALHTSEMAIKVSNMFPDDMAPGEAAYQFCEHMIDELKANAEKDGKDTFPGLLRGAMLD